MEECLKKVYNKKTQKAIETQYHTGVKTMKTYIETNKNNKSPVVKGTVTLFRKILKRMTLKRRIQKGKEDYHQTFCNPTCKATLFEAGDPDRLSPALIKSIKKELKVIDTKFNLEFWLKGRKDLFGKDKNVLKDGFYKGIDEKIVKKLRNRGAISGCYQDNATGLRLVTPLL